MYKKILLPVDVFEMDLSDKAVRHAESVKKICSMLCLMNTK